MLAEFGVVFLLFNIGKAVRVDPMKPTLKAPGTKRLKLKYDQRLSILLQFWFQFQLAPLHIGLELSYERLISMSKYIFGMGSAQMVLSAGLGTACAVACGLAVPPAVIIGMGLAFSSTAVALQVLQDRGETGARHGRATFSVLLFQDLTVRTHPLHPTPHPLQPNSGPHRSE